MNDSLTKQGYWGSIEVTTDQELLVAVWRKDRDALTRLYQSVFPAADLHAKETATPGRGN